MFNYCQIVVKIIIFSKLQLTTSFFSSLFKKGKSFSSALRYIRITSSIHICNREEKNTNTLEYCKINDPKFGRTTQRNSQHSCEKSTNDTSWNIYGKTSLSSVYFIFKITNSTDGRCDLID